MAFKAELELREAILLLGMVQPVKVEAKGSTVMAVCRLLSPDKAWLALVESLLRLAQDREIPLHIGTRFLLRDGKMVKGWDFGIEAQTRPSLELHLTVLKEALPALLEAVPMTMAPREAPPPVTPTMTMLEEEPEPPPEPPTTDPVELARRAEAYQKRTSATARPPSDVASNVPPPPNTLDLKPHVVFRGKAKDQKNRIVPVVIEEVPLPHMYHVSDMNEPNEKGRGAKTIG